jgi:D-alanyl-D-alanine carboxypeptidase/D-alanyl-D-alanine-endopeptidase (penicillin-binding protein 4)
MRARLLIAAIAALVALTIATRPAAFAHGEGRRADRTQRDARGTLGTRPTALGSAGPVSGWRREIDRLVGDRAMSVTIGNDSTFWYRHLAWVKRIPASNEKLLLSMALLDAVEPTHAIATRAMAVAQPSGGLIEGDLWLVGHGDPEVGPASLQPLAAQIAAAGITRITGSVVGDEGPFRRDWWARGWKDYFQADEVPFPTALTFNGNVGPRGGHIDDPERRAAAWFTKALRRLGVEVTGNPKMDTPTTSLVRIASVSSAPIIDIVRRMDVDSLNFDAEVLGKFLGARRSGVGSIASGARAIDAYTEANGAPELEHHDGSGLSYANRVTTQGIVRLLWTADLAPWGLDLREALPTTGQGTLEGRLRHLRVRAKTGTLNAISALSGWVWNDAIDDWIEFSIVSFGLYKSTAIDVEDAIVRIASHEATAAGVAEQQAH